MTDKEKTRNIIELFIAWNGETECIDVANLDSAVEFIDSSLQEELVSEDLKNAADNALEGLLDKYDFVVGTGSCLEMFKLGAEWQKEQMLVKSIEGTARPDDNEIWCDLYSSNLKDGDKCRVIVIKED